MIGRFDPMDLKVLATTITASIISPVDLLVKFLMPILGGIAWVFLKPYVVEWQKRYNDWKKTKKK